MFPSTRRTILFLLRTPLVPPPTGPAAMELAVLSSSAGPSRPRAHSRALSNFSLTSAPGLASLQTRAYASDHGKKELYSDEGGSTGAGTDDVAHTDAAFNRDPNPASAAKGVEQESGKDFTNRSSANPEYSHDPAKQGQRGGDKPLNTSQSEAKKNQGGA